ncbi:hypothetical protein BGZ83_004640 [Gryganskiella cystojenkinii]|nr:hypothetical protein BGZ83_004640 [Gryganskiella cystojenkinii]
MLVLRNTVLTILALSVSTTLVAAGTNNRKCLGADISQYSIVYPTEKKSIPKTGWFIRGTSLSQCSAVRVRSNPNYFYAMQSDGNFVAYDISTGKATSSTNSAGLGTQGDYKILFQKDGNLVIYDTTGKVIWSSGTYDGGINTMRLKPGFWSFSNGGYGIVDAAQGGNLYGAMWGTETHYAYQKVSIQLKSTDYCLDAGGTTSGTATMLKKCNGGVSQKWTIFTDGRIMSSQTGILSLCLDNSAFNAVEGAPITVYRCTGKSNQKWQLLSDGTIANPAVNYCVDLLNNARADGQKIQMWHCTAGVAQQWVIKR